MTAVERIRVMSPDLAQTIAAGEVVERPAAAVKELIDNALDAGARTVKVEIRDAGLKLIRVTDDGMGIPQADVALAFASHATSKIARFDDLQRLTTLGFRGEALPSIAAVARVEIQTRAEGEQLGTRYRIEFGEGEQVRSCSAPRGTRVGVSDLFSNVPARREFVRSLRAEAAQITDVVAHYALVRPDVQFSLSADDRPAFHSPGTGRLEDALAAVYGPREAEGMTRVDWDDGTVRVRGLTSRPDLNRPNRSAIHLSVNGRPVANRSLVFALEEAYSGLLMVGRHPMAALHLQLPSPEVDVNIHPSKSEVRFAHSRGVHGALNRAVASALLDARLSGKEFDQFEVVSPAERDDGMEPLPLPLPSPGPGKADPALSVPVLRVFGQANAMFIIAEGPTGLYMIDQHAAHERILFDQLDHFDEEEAPHTQPLLEPFALELTPAHLAAMEENRDLLERLGFILEPFGDRSCLVRSLPSVVRSRSTAELVEEVLAELEGAPEPRAARERALAMVACKAAVKAGQMLDLQEMRELVAQLERTPRPDTCPHGRPTMIHLSNSQLERQFGRQ